MDLETNPFIRRRPTSLRRLARRVLLWTAITLALIWTVFPIYWALISSIRPSSLGYRSVFVPWADFRPTLAHWRWEWTNRLDVTGLYHGIRNSLVVSLGTAFCCSIIALLAAVGLRSFEQSTRRTTAIRGLILLPRLIPPVLLLTPLYLLAVSIQMNDTLWSLIIVNTGFGLPMAVIVLGAAVGDVPVEILDAAFLDGASTIEVIRRMIVPLIAPIIWAVAILTFALSWNEFVFAVTNVSRNASTAPISIAFLDQRDGIDFEHVGSHIVLIVALPLVLAMLTQRVLVRGLAMGAVKG